MIEVTLERLRTHRANIVRYKRLLATHLIGPRTSVYRASIERRASLRESASARDVSRSPLRATAEKIANKN